MPSTLTQPKTTKKAKAKGGSLNSSNPNPYEVTYATLWEKLPPWKKEAFTHVLVTKQFDDYGMYAFFIKEVVKLAEENEH